MCFAAPSSLTHFIRSGVLFTSRSSPHSVRPSIRLPRRHCKVFMSTLAAPDIEDEQHLEIFHVTDSESGTRIDKLISDRFNERSRTYIQNLLSSGNVEINGKAPVPKSHRANEGEVVAIRFLPTQRELPLVPEDIDLSILYEDEHLAVINKPAGMVVHPAPGNWDGTLVHALSFRYQSVRDMGGTRPGIVHRLDKGTTGVIVTAKNSDVQAALTDIFAARGVEKDYVAITVGNPSGKDCIGRVIEESMGRSPTDRLRMCILTEEAGGKHARSVLETVASDDRGLLHAVKVKIETGRTHQIRVHLRHVRAPVLGDDLYGAPDINRRFRGSAERPMLHALRLCFKHPVTGNEIDVSAPLPDDMRLLMKRVVHPDFEEKETNW